MTEMGCWIFHYNRKNSSCKRKDFSKQNAAVEISSTGSSPCQMLFAILKIDEGRTQTNGRNDEKIDDNVQSLTCEL